MKYFLIRGVVRSLEIKKSRMELNISPKLRDGVALASIVETVMEISSSNALLASARDSTDMEMEYFKCVVDENELVGNFYKIGFSEGEEVEFVVEKTEAYYNVRAACSESQRLIWTPPNQTRGSVAQKRADIVGSCICSLVFALFFLLVMYFASTATGASKWEGMQISFFMAFGIVFLVNAITRLTFYRFSKEATQIFKVFGFLEPEAVDLLKGHKEADIQYRADTNSERSYHPAWQFRYNISQKTTLPQRNCEE